jgi:hypothetical protein
MTDSRTKIAKADDFLRLLGLNTLLFSPSVFATWREVFLSPLSCGDFALHLVLIILKFHTL